MVSSSSHVTLISAITLTTTLIHIVLASDPDITSDFILPKGVTLDANFFTFKDLRKAMQRNQTMPMHESFFKVTKASESEFKALKGQSVSLALLQFGPGGINPAHIHPRSAELLFILKGKLRVGFVDCENKVFMKVIKEGDVFVFPKGLVHFQMNEEEEKDVVAVAAFGSANPGVVVLPTSLFGSGIDSEVLVKSFKTDNVTIQKLISANMG
ncbi:Germin protein [Dioscorea alata]|uniref:Germin protein n=1 Tax=Dioscorea alata TaxID=55571 RepID=A0ACB7V6I1_DIOAL|nr:Germin protein [Dioscorea alata]